MALANMFDFDLEYLRNRTQVYLGFAYHGVDVHSDPGLGGEECLAFLPDDHKLLETLIVAPLSIFLVVRGAWRSWHDPAVSAVAPPPPGYSDDNLARRVVLFLMCITFGMELGYKLATGSLIWLTFPCHIITALQIYLLVATPSPMTMRMFRVMMHCLSGATIALLLPVVNTRLLTFEKEVYYIQHILMLVIPYYLMRVGGAYTPEPLGDYTYVQMAIGSFFFYHWTLMQGLAILTHVNMNNMICPAISDPFYGPYYRVAAFFHQTLLFCVHGKLYTFVSQIFLPKRAQEAQAYNSASAAHNGHAKTQ